MGLIKVYTDGSFWGDRGGFGVVFTMNGKMKKYSSECYYVDTTSQRMEIRPILYALKRIDTGHDIEFYTDSQYCSRTINEWLGKWIYYGTIKNKANPDLWFDVWEQIRRHELAGGSVKAIWVKGHNGDQLNELAHNLAHDGRGGWDPKVCKPRN